MITENSGYRSFLMCSLTVLAGLALCTGTGCNGDIGNGGGGDSRLGGTVTNVVTGAGLAGIAIALDPVVEGVDIMTGDDGTFSAALPAGVYTLTISDSRFEQASVAVTASIGVTAAANFALTPTTAVMVSASVDGDAVPGGTVSVSAMVEPLDGSTFQSIAWTQSNSVEVSISGANTQTATVTLPGESAYKEELLKFLAEPPVGEEELPENVELPEGEFPAGLLDRFYILGLNNFDLEEAGLVTLTASVTTSSGTYTQDVEIHTTLPWLRTLGIGNVPVGVPVLLQGKTQDSYDWSLSGPSGSSATLAEASSRNPEFTPDMAGTYTVTVTDLTGETADVVTLDITAGTWAGAITGQDANGRPLAANCTVCHNDGIAPDIFTPWAQTGHAEIFSDNLDTSTHYGDSCFQCHMVGFEPGVENGGADEATDYQAFVDAGLLNNPGDNWTQVLSDFPDTAQMANIQCENCHGPNNSSLHNNGEFDPERISLSADVCAYCHGEPLRHARFQQWQLSGHANYELAIDEGESGSCARCHTANGFLAWLPILLDDDPTTDPLDDVTVNWTSEETLPQTCVTCHDPHNVGTTTGVETNATVRIFGDTPPLIAGFTALGAGNGAICMTCHNSRRGLRNDSTFDDIVASGDAARAPHGSAQTDVLMGQNAFLVTVGVRASHSLIEDTCVNCHMEQTPPPDVLAYNLGGTNHTFSPRTDICSKCHGELTTAESVQAAFRASSTELQNLVETAILDLMAEQIAAGNDINLGGEATVTNMSQIDDIEFGESRGRQAITVTLSNGTVLGPLRLVDVTAVDSGGTDLGELYTFADERLIKSGWNWNLANNDGSKGVHNPPFVFQFMQASIDAMNRLAEE